MVRWKEEFLMPEIVEVGDGKITLPEKIMDEGNLEEGDLLDVGGGGIFAMKVDKKKEIENTFRLMGKKTDFTDTEEVVDYVRKIRSEVFEEWEESF